jgi:hypothetical protein
MSERKSSPKRRRPFSLSPDSPDIIQPSPDITSDIVQSKRRREPFTTSPSPPSSPQGIFQQPQSIVEGVDLSLQPKQRQGPPPDLSLQLPQSIVQSKRRRGPFTTSPSPPSSPQSQPRINLEKTIFILAACHGCLSTTKVKKSKGHPGFDPDLVTCNIRNLQKKTIAKPGHSVFFNAQHPRNTPNSKSLLDPTGTPFREMYSPRELPNEADDIKRYVDTLTQAEKADLDRKTASKYSNSINPYNPKQLLKDIIDHYESNSGNLSTTYPTKTDMIQQFNRGIYLSTLIDPGSYPRSHHDKEYINKLVYCDIHQDKEQYWECYYHRDDTRDTGLIIGFTIGPDMLYYDLYELHDLVKLIKDLEPYTTSDQLDKLKVDVFVGMGSREIADGQPNIDDDDEIRWINTSDIFNIVEIVQDILSKNNVVFIDFACKSIENVDEKEVEKSMEKLKKSGLYDETKMGHGGYHNNKSKSRKYKSKKSRKYKSKKSRKYKSKKSRKYK